MAEPVLGMLSEGMSLARAAELALQEDGDIRGLCFTDDHLEEIGRASCRERV